MNFALFLHGSGDIKSEGEINGGDNIEIKTAGSGNIDIKFKAAKGSADIRGSGNITISGESNEFSNNILGSGDIRAADLLTTTTSVKIAGSGDAHVNVKDKLNVRIHGSGDVKYKGSPKIESSIKGSGSVSAI